MAEDPKNPEDQFSTAVVRESNKEKADLLDELFGVMPSAARTEKALIDKNFTTRERRTAHSPMLQKRAMQVEASPTLTEQVRLVLRRH